MVSGSESVELRPNTPDTPNVSLIAERFELAPLQTSRLVLNDCFHDNSNNELAFECATAGVVWTNYMMLGPSIKIA